MKCDFSKLKSIAKWALHFQSSLPFFILFFSIFKAPSAFYFPLPPTIGPGSQYLSPSSTENSNRASTYTSTISEETEEEEEQDKNENILKSVPFYDILCRGGSQETLGESHLVKCLTSVNQVI